MSNRASTTEQAFEDTIVRHLCEHGRYELGDNERWSRELALDRHTLLEFIRATQIEAWEKLSAIHGSDIERRFMLRLFKELDNRGTIDVLRHGIVDYSVRFKLAFFKPTNGFNTETEQLYDKNRLTVFRQLHYSTREEHTRASVDLVLTLNGLPVTTIELKNQFTGRSSADGRQQYIETRDPREQLFAFKRRALVHFVIDSDEVWMTTQINGRETLFLPFNRGQQIGEHTAAGNPLNPNGQRTAYLWEDILLKDSWMEIIGDFVHLQRDTIYVSGRVLTRDTLIFPRYHQLDVVRRLLTDVRDKGPGHNYLIQHSAGSGKSNSIAWLAHALSNLHNAQGRDVVFNSVVVVTDRRVLDRQLQETIFQFQHQQGVVVKIEDNSQQLLEALRLGAKIIVTTLQKFPFVVEEIAKLPNRRYAVIVDEAHSSQSGKAADALRGALAERSVAYTTNGDEERDYQDEIVRSMESRRAAQRNMSFFAFTATPKPRTLAVFGTLGQDGKPRAFHLYSMQQAIEERFILDVLQHYTTYALYFKLTKAITDDPKLNKKEAARAIARFIRLHPHNIAQKVAVIIEHFRIVVMGQIGGQAKAMVVTSGRPDAVRYKQEVDRYLKENDYTSIKALVAFSGSVRDDYDIEYTERDLNGFRDNELPARFASDEYRLLLVADKYQTGFDQPLLHTMYVDKKLSGIRAVQTLSRLNRIYPGKDDTFVLDFANDTQAIQEAFQPFYNGTTMEEDVDPNQLYDMQRQLLQIDVLRTEEIDGFARVFFQPRTTQTRGDHARLSSFIDPAVTRFRSLAEDEREAFHKLLAGFLRRYSFLAQIMPFSDIDLETLYAYGRLLVTKLRADDSMARFQIQDEVALEYYRLQKISDGSIVLEPNREAALRSPGNDLTQAPTAEEAPLSTIIEMLNQRFGTAFTPQDQLFIDQIELDLASIPTLAPQAQMNTIDHFDFPFKEQFDPAFIARMSQNQDFVDRVMSEDRFREVVYDELLRKVYARLRGT
jgi:type I restriction enzyme, R subunit